MMSKRSPRHGWTFAMSVLISIGKARNALLLEHSLVVANAVVS